MCWPFLRLCAATKPSLPSGPADCSDGRAARDPRHRPRAVLPPTLTAPGHYACLARSKVVAPPPLTVWERMEDLPPRDAALSALDEVEQRTVALLGAAREGRSAARATLACCAVDAPHVVLERSQSRHPLSSERLDGFQATLLGALGKYSAACSDRAWSPPSHIFHAPARPTRCSGRWRRAVKEHDEVYQRIQNLETAIGDREERIRTAVRRLHDANRVRAAQSASWPVRAPPDGAHTAEIVHRPLRRQEAA